MNWGNGGRRYILVPGTGKEAEDRRIQFHYDNTKDERLSPQLRHWK